MRMIYYSILFVLLFAESVYSGWLEMGRMPDTPFLIETSFSYENNVKYYDYELKEMRDFPEDWDYKEYEIVFRLGLYVTKNIRLRFNLPYYINRKLKFEYDGNEDFVEGEDFANYEIDLKYTFCYFKRGLWGVLKKGSVEISYMFDNGSKEDLISGVSYGRNEIDVAVDFEIFFFPKIWSEYLNKNLIFKPKFEFEKTGRVWSGVIEYSKSGFDRGDEFGVETKFSYQINRYAKVETYFYYEYTTQLRDIYDVPVPDSEEYEYGVGGAFRWKIFGGGTELGLKFEYPISYKSSYISLFNPTISLKFLF